MLFDNLQGEFPDKREILGGIALTRPGGVLLERDVQHPVEVVPDGPVPPRQHVVNCVAGEPDRPAHDLPHYDLVNEKEAVFPFGTVPVRKGVYCFGDNPHIPR